MEKVTSGLRPISTYKESDIERDDCGVTDYSACYQPMGNHLCKDHTQKEMWSQRNYVLSTMPDFTYYLSKP